MPKRGDNLPGFMARQLAFAAYIRNPEVHPAPTDVEPRRMQVYLDLFFNNIEGFLARGFPIAKKVLSAARWQLLVREFLHRHPSRSPYFLEISQEFLTFLHDARPDGLPPFFLELCHYEWVELALAVAEEDLPEEGIDPEGDLMRGSAVVSPLLWKLSYCYPVHKIGPDFLPAEPGVQPTCLLVNRKRDDSVGFVEANPLTLRLLELLEGGEPGEKVLNALVQQLPHLQAGLVVEKGVETIERLRKAEIILGSVAANDGQ